MPNYRSSNMCGGCPYFGEEGQLCKYKGTAQKEKRWVKLPSDRYTFREELVIKYKEVVAAFGTNICWRKTEAMKIAKVRTGSEGNWEQFTSELTSGA